MRCSLFMRSVLLCCLGLCSPAWAFIPQINMLPGVTETSRDIYFLHMTIFLICVVIGVVVFGFMIFAMIKYRRSKGVEAEHFHEKKSTEIILTVIPFLILVVMAVPATRVLVDMYDTNRSEVDIKVTGYQWKWRYEYLNEGISFYSNLATPMDAVHGKEPKGEWYLLDVDNPLVLPIHTKIRFVVTSNDVIHSWWVPAFAVKRDAIPGFIHEAWTRIDKPGIYRGQCAELCGQLHGYMPIVVKAVTKVEYRHWVEAHQNQNKAKQAEAAQEAVKEYTKDELMQMGEAGYKKHCAACHKEDGSGMPPAFPALKGSPLAIGDVAAHIDIILHGKKGTAMQAFGEQLNDTDIAAITTYERNAWGNDKLLKAGAVSIVQPKDIAAARQK